MKIQATYNKVHRSNSIVEKVKQYGYDYLTAVEKLKLAFELIGYYGKNSDFQSIHELFNAPEHKLKEIFSKTQFVKLSAVRELQAQYLQEEIMFTKKELSSPAAVKDFLISKIGSDSQESLICIYVDSKNQYIDCKTMSSGTVDQVIIYPREIIKNALLLEASGIIIAHNHPSGIPDPSGADIRLTEQVKIGAEALGLKVLDHLIVGRHQHFSFLENSLLEAKTDYNSPPEKSKKELNFDKTIKLNEPISLSGRKNIKEAFLEGLKSNKKSQIKVLNKQLQQILGYDKLDIKHLPYLANVIDDIYNAFEVQYLENGYIDFEKNNLTEGNLTKLLSREAYSLFEEHMLEEKQLAEFEKIIPNSEIRRDLFAQYARKRSIDLSTYTHYEENLILRLFEKIFKGIEKIMGRKTELEKLFHDFAGGRLAFEPSKPVVKNIVESKDLYKYKTLKGIDVISGDVNFSEFNFSNLGDVNEITGKAVLKNSEIMSLGKLKTVGLLDIRESKVNDLGKLKSVKNNVYSNEVVQFDKWKDVSIDKDIYSFGAKMTKAYHKLIEAKKIKAISKEKNIPSIER